MLYLFYQELDDLVHWGVLLSFKSHFIGSITHAIFLRQTYACFSYTATTNLNISKIHLWKDGSCNCTRNLEMTCNTFFFSPQLVATYILGSKNFIFPNKLGPSPNTMNKQKGWQNLPLKDVKIIFKGPWQPTRKTEPKAFRDFKPLANLFCSGLLPELQYLESTFIIKRNY